MTMKYCTLFNVIAALTLAPLAPAADDTELSSSATCSKGIAGVQLINADGQLDTQTPGIVTDDKTIIYQHRIKDLADLDKASLKILVRQGGELKVLPFEFHNLEIQ